jgi:hypothetical protein
MWQTVTSRVHSCHLRLALANLPVAACNPIRNGTDEAGRLTTGLP